MRTALFVIGVVGLAASIAWFPAVPVLWPVAFWSIVLVAALAFERHRYKRLESGDDLVGWDKTGESFIDPETSTPVSVYYNPRTGERRYVKARASAG